MLATETRCARCRRLLSTRDEEHRCRTMEEQLDSLRALSEVRRVTVTADPRAAMAMRERREAAAPIERRDIA